MEYEISSEEEDLAMFDYAWKETEPLHDKPEEIVYPVTPVAELSPRKRIGKGFRVYAFPCCFRVIYHHNGRWHLCHEKFKTGRDAMTRWRQKYNLYSSPGVSVSWKVHKGKVPLPDHCRKYMECLYHPSYREHYRDINSGNFAGDRDSDFAYWYFLGHRKAFVSTLRNKPNGFL